MPAFMPNRIPVSSYRLQLNGQFTFHDAAKLAPYLHDLGITEIYSSPILAAVPGSTHGYDTCDHHRINPDLGAEAGLAELALELKSREMGLIVDFVPNHMSIDQETNLWWRNVLENGPSSPYAKYFDIEWRPIKWELHNKVLLPVLGHQYGTSLDNGDLQIEFHDGVFNLKYYSHNLPLNPRQLRIILRHNLAALENELPADDPQLTEFLSILFHLDSLPPYTEDELGSMMTRQREKEVVKQRIVALVAESPQMRRHIECNVRAFNGIPNDEHSYDLLHELLEAQPYRLAFWGTAMHEINYRRFFDINELAAIRMEDPEVFSAAHELIFRLIGEGIITGLRLDHIDGLFDPQCYLKMLRDGCPVERRPYVVVEKILTGDEVLEPTWPVDGTTGYEFLNQLNGLFVDSGGAAEFRRIYRRYSRGNAIFSDIVYACKKLIISTSMASELNVLAHELNRISESDRHSRDFTLFSLQDALTEVVACFPVYRTYFQESGFRKLDRTVVDSAVQDALSRNPAAEPSIFEFIRQMLLPERKPGLSEAEYARRVRFAKKFQQYTGPVHAKGVEDTAFYRYGPLLSLNEVGGEPSRFGIAQELFHQCNVNRLDQTPLSMLCTSTHDTKRGEDARARLNVLSEIPKVWSEQLRRWTGINAQIRTYVHGAPAPDRSDEYLYYQALLGAWPVDDATEPSNEFVERMYQFMSKATKEKKEHTSWIQPSQKYDDAVRLFVSRTLRGTHSAKFLAEFLPFQQHIARLGMINSLAQLILKLVSPGVPDFYQGSEWWEFSLVDPDNRRKPDFQARKQSLDAMKPLLEQRLDVDRTRAEMSRMLSKWQNGSIKQFITAAGLRIRSQDPELFLRGEYIGISAEGSKRDHVVSCMRRIEGRAVVGIVPRLPVKLVGLQGGLPLGRSTWADTAIRLPNVSSYSSVYNVLTQETWTVGSGYSFPIAELLNACPVALLVLQSSGLSSGKEGGARG